jgi:hypothetical protein
VEKVTAASQSKSSNVWIYDTVCTGYTWSLLTLMVLHATSSPSTAMIVLYTISGEEKAMASGRMMAAPTCVKMQCVKMQCVKVQCVKMQCVKVQCVKMQCVKVQCMRGVKKHGMYEWQVECMSRVYSVRVECTSEIMSECTSIE